MYATITAIDYHLPETVLSNEQLELEFPDWTKEKIAEKTGIVQRRIADFDECASDLAFKAAKKLFASGVCDAKDIDFLLLCTQSPDYFLPSSACILQERLGLSTFCGALDFNLGCSGYVYGLALAKGLIESKQAINVLLITAETYSKYIKPSDKSGRTIFGDGAAVTLVQSVKANKPNIFPTIFGTDGTGAKNLIVRGGCWREKNANADLYMNGSEIFAFTLKIVPPLVKKVLHEAALKMSDIDLFVLHQANKYMLDHLRHKLEIPEKRFYLFLQGSGNTVSATIPIALKHALSENKVKSGDLVMLVGFGVGYSWGGTIVRIA